MRVMAVDTVISLPATTVAIPVPAHPAMRSIAVITVLRSVTLCAELERVPHRNISAVRKAEGESIARIVTRQAAIGPMREVDPLMRRTDVLHALFEGRGEAWNRVTVDAADAHRLTVRAYLTRRDALELGRRVDGHARIFGERRRAGRPELMPKGLSVILEASSHE